MGLSPEASGSERGRGIGFPPRPQGRRQQWSTRWQNQCLRGVSHRGAEVEGVVEEQRHRVVLLGDLVIPVVLDRLSEPGQGRREERRRERRGGGDMVGMRGGD